MEEVTNVTSKAGIAIGDMVLEKTLTRKSFGDIPNILMCRDKKMLVVWDLGARGESVSRKESNITIKSNNSNCSDNSDNNSCIYSRGRDWLGP